MYVSDVFMFAQIVNFRWCSVQGGYIIQAYEKGFIRKQKGMNVK